jgi:hypothetical protein
MLPEIGAASIARRREQAKEKIRIVIISPNEMARAFRMHRSIGKRNVVYCIFEQRREHADQNR